MKKIVLLISAIVLATSFSFAQKYAYVDTEYILSNIPEYNDAQTVLDDLSMKWQKEIEEKLARIDQMYQDYQSEAVLLPEDVKQKREQEIIQAEQEVKELQKNYFGREGMLFQKRKELVQPIQERVYNVISDIATTKNYDFVFDKSGSISILYANNRLDISDDVLDEVGSVMQTVPRGERQ